MRVVAAGREAEDRVVAEELTIERPGVGVGQELVRVPAQPAMRIERPVDAEAVPLPRPDARHVAVPDVVGHLLEPDPVLAAVVAEQADVDALGLRCEQCEVGALAVPRRAERRRAAGPAGGLIGHGPTSFTYDVVLALIFSSVVTPAAPASVDSARTTAPLATGGRTRSSRRVTKAPTAHPARPSAIHSVCAWAPSTAPPINGPSVPPIAHDHETAALYRPRRCASARSLAIAGISGDWIISPTANTAM